MGIELSAAAYLDRLINNPPWCKTCKIPGVFAEWTEEKREEGSEVFNVGFECPGCGGRRTGKLMVGRISATVEWSR